MARVTCTSEWADSNPNMDDMPAGSAHYRVTLRYKGRQLTTYYSMGPALCREPEAHEVLNCLISDASWANDSFESFCADCGFDPDSRRAERIYKACCAIAPKLERLLGQDYDFIAEQVRD